MRKLKIYIVLIIITLFAVRNIAQCQYRPFRIAHNSGLTFISGFTYGVGETIVSHHSGSVFSGFPPTHFFGSESWKRKYKNYPTDMRQRFFGSKTVFVSFTDGYHLSRSVSRYSLNAAIITYRQPDKGWHKVLDFCILQGAFIAGFHLEQILLE